MKNFLKRISKKMTKKNKKKIYKKLRKIRKKISKIKKNIPKSKLKTTNNNENALRIPKNNEIKPVIKKIKKQGTEKKFTKVKII